MPDELLSTSEAAERMGITTKALRHRIKHGLIKYQVIGGHYRISPEDAVPGRLLPGRKVDQTKEQTQ